MQIISKQSLSVNNDKLNVKFKFRSDSNLRVMPNEQKCLKQHSKADVKNTLELIMLPDEILLHIFEHLSDESVFHCQKVCRQFQKIAKEVYCRNFRKLKEKDPSCSSKTNGIRKKCKLAGSFVSAASTDCSFGGIVHWRGATFTERSKNAVANTSVEALITKLLNLMIITELSDLSNPKDWHLNVGEFLEIDYQPQQSSETSFDFHVEGSPAIVQSLRNCVLEEDIFETIYLPKDCCNCKFTLTSQANTPSMGSASSAISLKIDIKTT